MALLEWKIDEGSFSFRKISAANVGFAICKLKESCSAGHYGLEAKDRKLVVYILMFYREDLFNLSTRLLPTIWKCSRVTSIIKNCNPSHPNNYHPISIICTITNIFLRLFTVSEFLQNPICSPVWIQTTFFNNHSPLKI